jgi:D-alanyl-lipoteichoic acid acyltransferase DltB (MBOAT superfamily)
MGVPDNSLSIYMAEQGLPIGISFYTLQGIAYLVDYGRGRFPKRGFKSFLLFESFFGQLIAGPIVRYDELMPQLDYVRKADYSKIMSGIELFALGLFKKLVLGDRSAHLVDPVFSNPGDATPDQVVTALILYTVQIYGDFSGYMDMGRGGARICGIELPKNFDSPYWSRSISEFWRRWHITLGRWIKDYIYIPLGGNRCSFWRSMSNMMFTMLICGLWHGAAWNFVIWGFYHGSLMAVERIYSRLFPSMRLSNIVAIPLTLVMVMFGWLIFRVERVEDIMLFSDKLLDFDVSMVNVHLLTAIFLFSVTLGIQWMQRHHVLHYLAITMPKPAVRGATVAAIVVSALALRGYEAPFIYFEF